MESRKSRLSFVLGAALAAFGCVTADSLDAPEREPRDPDAHGDREYNYYLGFDPVTGKPIYGGSHRVVVFGDERGKAEAIDSANMPSRLHPQLTGDYLAYDASLTGGTTDWDYFPSAWWPQSSDGIAWRWQPGAPQDLNNLGDRDRLSPTEKYDLLVFPGQQRAVAERVHCQYSDFVGNGDDCTKITRPALTVAGPATKWELENHGNYQSYGPEGWWGHCNGWASYATAEPLGYPKRDVRVKLEQGQILECKDASDPACILFKMGDVEGLLSELYFSDSATFTGRRCNTEPDEMERDEFGRPVDVACRDLNPGSFHVAMSGLLGRGAKNLVTNEEGQRPAFIIDHDYANEVWNFPLVKYEIRSQEEVSLEQANQMIGANGSSYAFNPQASRFIAVRAKYYMVSASVPPWMLLQRADQRNIPLHPVDLNYVLELDEGGKILGGEWIQDPSTSWGSDSKKLHPDFAWMALSPIGPGENADDTGGVRDNPFISYPIVQALLRCANEPESCASDDDDDDGGAPSLCEGNCGGGPFTENGASCYCDSLCTTYNDCCGGYADTCTSGDDGGGDDPEPSCAGHCGSAAAVPGSSPACYCDSLCTTYNDCCGDAAAVCDL